LGRDSTKNDVFFSPTSTLLAHTPAEPTLHHIAWKKIVVVRLVSRVWFVSSDIIVVALGIEEMGGGGGWNNAVRQI
jgi:hypothetical protein